MLALKELEKEILTLQEKDYSSFRDWFYKQDSEKWDKQIEEDIHSGELDSLAQKALSDFNSNSCKEL